MSARQSPIEGYKKYTYGYVSTSKLWPAKVGNRKSLTVIIRELVSESVNYRSAPKTHG
ncbi:hypothetical protein [Staphylococcus phage vB_SauH_DELF3]|nr:hypothetical protein [Staphylococcus phage vB_SauH_DELF3]